MENQMLCYQCGCAKEGKYCNDTIGACGKSAETSRLQDELTGALIGLAKASVHKSVDDNVQRLIVEGLAATAAHTDFDNEYLFALTEQIKAAKTKYIPKFGDHNTSLKLPEDFDIRLIWQKTPDVRSLKSLLLFGIRGIALYAYESWSLGSKNKEAASFFHKALIALGANHFKEDYYTLLEEMGGIGLRAMELTEKARFSTYGSPTTVKVPRVIEPGPFIIVSGHNFEILERILEQTKDSGVAVYSHGEMLPAHSYPLFRKYRHFIGHYGTSWQNQQNEFDHIPAAIVFTSGCMMLPLNSYADRCFTAGTARIQGIPHLDNDFTPAMIRSIELGGAPQQIVFPGINGGTAVTTGFSRKSIRTVSYKLAAALAEGNVHHIYVVGGCDGTEAERQSYTDLIRRIPDDAVVFTWGCAKYRFNDIDYGEIGGVPRIIDVGMCNDLPLMVETINSVAESAKLRVEELPLTWHYTWQEQRSVAELFALFAADIQNVVLGPSLPPYFTEDVFRTVTKEYRMTLISDALKEEAEETDDSTLTAEIYKNGEEIVATIAVAPEESEENTHLPAEDAVDTGADMDIEDRAEAAGLPAWAIADEDEDDDYDEEIPAPAPEAPKIRPEDIDQTPAFAMEDDEEDLRAEIPAETPMDIESRSAAAGLPAWAMEEDEEEIILTEEDIIPVTASAAPMKKIYEDETEKAVPTPKETTEDKEPELYRFKEEEPPKIALPKGAGVSGWKDPDEEPAFVPSAERKPFHYTPPKELIEIEQPAPIVLPAGAGVSGFAANHDLDQNTPEDPRGEMYSFAEPLPEIKIPKGKGVSGWKEEDDEIRPAKRNSGADSSSEKPWLKKSLEKLHAEVESDNKAPDPIPSAIPKATPKIEEKVADAPAEDPAIVAAENSGKPWLAQSLKTLKESIAADEEATANKNSDKPWLKASLEQLHAEVEAEQGGEANAPAPKAPSDENDEETYVSQYHHDAASAADKPWLKTSIEELKASIDRDAGIKSVRKDEKKAPAAAKTEEEVAAQWQNTTAAPAWKDIAPATSTDNVTPSVNTVPAEEHFDEPTGGGEPPEAWQKPQVLPKPWDKDLQTVWKKPDVLPKPWEMQQPSMYHNPSQDTPAQGHTIPNLPMGTPVQGNAPASPQLTVAQQFQWEAEQEAAQQALAEQQAAAEQQALIEAQQQAMAEQQALLEAQRQASAQWEAQQQELSMQQAYLQQQQLATQEAEQRAIAASQNLEEQAAQIRATRAAQESYAAQLQEQAYRIQEARNLQAAQAAQLEQQAQQLEQLRIQQESQKNRQSMQERREQAAYAAQLEQQAQQLRQAQAQQEAYRNQLEQEAARMQSARAQQEEQAARLNQQEQLLQQAMLRQQTPNPYQFGVMPAVNEVPSDIPRGAGVSGYRQTGFIPGQERPSATDAIQTLREIPPAAAPNIAAGTGISGSRYHEELPPIQTDYSQTYGVPQTPRVNLPRGMGISGWNDPTATAPTQEAPTANFFGFMNSDAPAGVRSNSEVITPGSGDEFIATTGPDGEVTLTIRTDKK